MVPQTVAKIAICDYIMASGDCLVRDGSWGGGGGGVGVATPPNDFEQPLPLIYKAYYIAWHSSCHCMVSSRQSV